MKGFERKNQLFSLCGLNCGLCPMRLGNYCGGCGNGNQSLNIAMSAKNIRVKNINTLMIMILSSRINGEKQI